MKRFFQFGLLFAVMAFSVFGADPSGKWTASMPGRNGDTMSMTFNLKADGDKLTGTVAGMRGDTDISDGKVNGDTVTFSVLREYNGNSFKTNYTGTMEGDTIHFTMTREGGNGRGGERKFDAKKE
jgi:hypothetical protein